MLQYRERLSGILRSEDCVTERYLQTRLFEL
jgi:hypothetical protein